MDSISTTEDEPPIVVPSRFSPTHQKGFGAVSLYILWKVFFSGGEEEEGEEEDRNEDGVLASVDRRLDL